jgi:hypothetical protein
MPGLDPLALLAAWDHGIRQDPLERALTLLAAARDDAGGEGAAVDVGSRDVVLARLLERTAGGVVWGRTACGSCGEPLDVPVDVAAIARLPVHEADALLSATVDGAEVRFRLPTSEDLRRLRGMAPAEARRWLLARCVAADTGANSEAVAEAVQAAMEQASPAGAIELEVGCPACGARTTTALDISILLWAEIQAQAVGLLGDVHALAAAYGWSEAEVLALSPERRAIYLDMAGT